MYRRQIIETAAKKLDQYQMIRFDERTQQFESIDLGRIASHYYINSETVEVSLLKSARFFRITVYVVKLY